MDAPPSYDESNRHQERNGIPASSRRSMEDEQRPLPQGWMRQYDQESHHQFFVDTTKTPPRSIWSHPYDDEQYLSSISPEERAHLTRLNRSVSLKDIEAESSDDEDHSAKKAVQQGGGSSGRDEQLSGLHKYGRKMKDKLTNSTHQERERERQIRAEQEQQAYRAHMAFRQAMSKAIQTGQPQLFGKDKNGNDCYVEPPNGPRNPYGGGGRGFNPYATGPYGNPNARFMRPQMPYARPYGYGYGGGYGMPLAGGLMGGALLGGLLF